ncbi:MAG: hypothetical protein WC692_09900 [Erythrobacter sp.]|jgi:hypothetical protein
MLKPVIAAAAALILLCAPASADEPAQEAMTKGEARLAKLLDGRVAGEPERCIRTFGTGNLTQIDGTALVYKQGRTVWVNRTRTPDAIDDNEIMVIRRFDGTNLCRTDHITLVDRLSGMFSGILLLEDFVPYRKAATEG